MPRFLEYLLSNASFVFLLLSMMLYVYVHFSVRPQAQKQVSGRLVRSNQPKVVLVTGGAGFIGFHLSLALLQRKHQVYIIDNFNDYYDVRLKIDRAYELHKLGVTVYNEDLCSEDFLEELFASVTFTHVVHLSAQAGVRYSLTNPQAYIKANLQCQLALMNVLKSRPFIRFVYASSSSVYGKEASVPFHLTARTDRPGNMYAATKKTDELLGLHYCLKYGLKGVGLRFFTVYGPWGRPDMSVYLFAEAIMNGQPVPMFHVSDSQPLGRDFTYVGDIITGVMASMDYEPAQCGERFNLGFGNPVSLPAMIDILMEKLGIKGQIDKLPLPATEILQTWADISVSEALLDFHPKTNLTIGVNNFVEWYLPYRQSRQDEKVSGVIPEAEKWFGKLLDDQIGRHKRYQNNKEMRERERDARNIQLDSDSDCEKQITFLPYAGSSFTGYDIISYPEFKGSILVLQDRCQKIPYCAAFTSDGTLKSKIPPRSDWLTNRRDVDLYVSTTDWCKIDVCHEYAACLLNEKDLYTCKCPADFHGDGKSCVPSTWLPHLFPLELHNVFNVTEMKQGRQLHFFKGVDSPGKDLMYLPHLKGKPKELEEMCRQNPLCIGFNTEGYLKVTLLGRTHWRHVEDSDESAGLYVYDINYCLLDDDSCPEFSDCVHTGIAESSCVCEEDYVMVNNECIKVYVSRALVPSIASCQGQICRT